MPKRTFEDYAKEPRLFRNDLLVDVSGEVKYFGKVQDEWQKNEFLALDEALLSTTGQKASKTCKTRAFLERARGHSKTTDLGVVVCYALAFATRPLKGYAFAADKDQAALLKDAINRILRLNPWLSEILEVQRDQVINKAEGHPGEDSTLTISTSDVGSSYGILPDFIIADELCHWQDNAGQALWESLISSAAKRANCLMVVITNAGFLDTWQWKVREAVRKSRDWYFSHLNGAVASWITEDRLEEQRKMLPAVAYSRLWENQWSTGGGDALTPDDINAAFTRERPMCGEEMGYLFVAGVDLGIKRDCSAICVLAVEEKQKGERRIRLAKTKLWRPKPGKSVDLSEVEDVLRKLHEEFQFVNIAYDPWQAEHLAQRLRAEGMPMYEMPPSGKNLSEIASRVIESFTDKRLELYRCPDLTRDLFKLRVEERSYGYRLVSPNDEHGHGDMASAFGMALLTAYEEAGRIPLVAGVAF